MLSRSLIFPMLLAMTSATAAQVAETSDLYQRIMQADRLLFEDGYNRCRLDKLDALLAGDFHFIHDQNGAASKPDFMKGFKDSICSNPERKPIRMPVAGTIQVFPLHNEGRLYGAIETGEHDFYIKEPGKQLYKTNTGRFTNVWLQTKSGWQISESLSYDHHDPRPADQFDAVYPAPLFDNRAKILALMRHHNIPSMVVARIADGKIAEIRAFGTNDGGHAVPTDAIYNVASLTKPVTGLTVLKLVAAGQWSLDEPLSDYYVDPDVAGSPYLRDLTTRTVLTQRSGFPNWRYLTPSKKLTFEFRPGTRYQYSGEGFEYLRKALENKFHKGLEELAQQQVFGPLGMKDTHYSFASNIDVSRYGPPHDANGKPIDLPRHFNVNAAANLLTTAPDYARMMAALLNGAGLPPPLYKDMITPQAHKAPDVDWGLGWGIYQNLGSNRVYALQHTGGDDGIKAIAVLLPESRDGILVIANSENGISLWKKILEEALGDVGADLVKRNLANPDRRN
jgi:CubicO group peptidase (beta-lactamase class C family)